MSTKTIEFKDSSIADVFSAYIYDARNMFVPHDSVGDLYRVVFNTIATLLKYQRNKNKPNIGFKLMNDAGEFKLGAILSFHAPEGETDDTGNWTLTFTFNEADMQGLDDVYDNYSDMFFTVANQEVQAAMNGGFATTEYCTYLFVSCIEVLQQQLDTLASGGEDVDITMPGIFMAGVGFEDGEKVYYVTPGHNIKQLIKDDKGLSKSNVVTLTGDQAKAA